MNIFPKRIIELIESADIVSLTIPDTNDGYELVYKHAIIVLETIDEMRKIKN